MNLQIRSVDSGALIWTRSKEWDVKQDVSLILFNSKKLLSLLIIFVHAGKIGALVWIIMNRLVDVNQDVSV